MRILYKQPERDENSALSRFGVGNCYCKKLSIDRDHSDITKKSHHHTGFEIHIVTQGCQDYVVDGATYKLESGKFLILYPNTPHTVLRSAVHTQKYSLTFNKEMDRQASCFFGVTDKRVEDNLSFILNEVSLKKEILHTLVENSLLEILVLLFRQAGVKENEKRMHLDENATLAMAKQYIEDNIETALCVADVSAYCYLSPKQLTRLFNKFESISPGEYIIGRRVKRIEKLLADRSFSLKQIATVMHFDNEYYFNAFFKKHAGMPPGEYRRMLGK